MVHTSVGLSFIVACVFLAGVFLVGIFSMFSMAENVERPIVVGGLTMTTALVAILLLDHNYRMDFPSGSSGILGICIVAISGFAIGRAIDFMMGGRTTNVSSQEEILGANLAD